MATSGNDTLSGTRGADDLRSGGGNDLIKGSAGNDHEAGGSGNDTVNGGSGSDHISGGQGDDNLNGGKGDDHIYGGQGDDRINGGSGYDSVLYLQDRSNYVITYNHNTDKFTVLDKSGFEGKDTVWNVEDFNFGGHHYDVSYLMTHADIII